MLFLPRQLDFFFFFFWGGGGGGGGARCGVITKFDY